MPVLKCPVCGGDVEVPDDALPGEFFEHYECGSQLELEIDENGEMRLRQAEEISEDWGE